MPRIDGCGDPALAAEAMRQHVQAALGNTLLRLKPSFPLSKQTGETYARSAKRRAKVQPAEDLRGAEPVLA